MRQKDIPGRFSRLASLVKSVQHSVLRDQLRVIEIPFNRECQLVHVFCSGHVIVAFLVKAADNPDPQQFGQIHGWAWQSWARDEMRCRV